MGLVPFCGLLQNSASGSLVCLRGCDLLFWDDLVMAKGYRPVVRDQPFLLPPDMREWLPADHPVWLVIKVVDDHLDTSAFHAARRTGGRGDGGV